MKRMASATRRTMSLLLVLLLVFPALPAPALAEMAEEAMGEEPVATAQVPGRDERRDEAVAGVDGGLPTDALSEGDKSRIFDALCSAMDDVKNCRFSPTRAIWAATGSICRSCPSGRWTSGWTA